jgi:hypothetical protein
MSASCEAVLVDVSFSGARLRGEHLPSAGTEILVRAYSIEVLGTVAWSRLGECGVHFDAPLPSYELAVLKHEGELTSAAGVTPEERQAIRDWAIGLAR